MAALLHDFRLLMSFKRPIMQFSRKSAGLTPCEAGAGSCLTRSASLALLRPSPSKIVSPAYFEVQKLSGRATSSMSPFLIIALDKQRSSR